MAVISRALLKTYFKTNDYPSQVDFETLIDTLSSNSPIVVGAVGDGTTDDTAALVDADNTYGMVVLPYGKTFRVSTNTTFKGPIIYNGGKIKLDDGVTITASVIATPAVQVFDISALAAVQGMQIADNEWVWGLNGGLVTKNLVVHAGWFGATSGAADSSKYIQAALDSGADVVGIDGDYTFTANFFGNGHVTSTKPNGGRAKLTMKTQTASLAVFAAGGYATHWAGGAKTFGLKNKGNVKWAKISRLELDGACESHWDWSDEYSEFKTGTTFDKKYLCSANGISASEDASAVANGWVLAPDEIVVEDVYSHHWARNCLLFNRTPKVTVSRCTAKYSAIDHCVYADTNLDFVNGGLEVGGYCEGGMIVTAGGTLNDIFVQDIVAHPLTDLYTTAVVQDRTDNPQATEINNMRIIGDMAQFHATDASQRNILRSMGKKFMRWSGGWVTHTGDATIQFQLWGIGGSTSNQYAGPIIEGVELRDMPSGFRFMNVPATEVKFAHWKDSQIRFKTGAAAFTGAFVEVSTCSDFIIKGLNFDAAQNLGCNQICIAHTGSINDFIVQDVHWPCGSNNAQWATTAGSFVRCAIINSRLRVSQPNTRVVPWRDSYFGGSIYPANQSTIESIVTNGSSATYNVSHPYGTGDVSVSVTPMDSISRAAKSIGVSRNNGSVTLYWENIPTSGTMTVGVDIRLTV